MPSAQVSSRSVRSSPAKERSRNRPLASVRAGEREQALEEAERLVRGGLLGAEAHVVGDEDARLVLVRSGILSASKSKKVLRRTRKRLKVSTGSLGATSIGFAVAN